jgi:chorismate mutase/prephenate dehydratase
MSQKELETLRHQIDDIDNAILNHLARRVETIRKIIDLKTNSGEEVFVPEREAQILNRLKKSAGNNLTFEEVENVFLPILSVCRSRQSETRISVFGEKNGWVEDSARHRVGSAANISNVENAEDFLHQVRNVGALGFACVTPQFANDRVAMIDFLLDGKLFIVEEFVYSPEFAVVTNNASDLSEVHELCVTNEMLRLLRDFFLSISFDLKINICRSTSEAFDNLKSINPVGAVLPVKQLEFCDDVIVLQKGLRSEMIGPAKFMVFSGNNRKVIDDRNCKATILCALNSVQNMTDLMNILVGAEQTIIDVQTIELESKPWQKLVTVEIEAPGVSDASENLVKKLVQTGITARLCGIYPTSRVA